MNFLKKLFSLFQTQTQTDEVQPVIIVSKEKIAQHEAAHGIVWYLFRENWTVNQLTIERINLPEDNMNGALHISPNFDENENNIERVNELFAIALAGVIGQNINLIIQRPNLTVEILHVRHFNEILDTTGCGGDFEIASNYLAPLATQFKTNQYSFTKYKLLDLINMFQNHRMVLQIHSQLSLLLLDKGTLNSEEITNFFHVNNFQEYIEEENLDINFFHQAN